MSVAFFASIRAAARSPLPRRAIVAAALLLAAVRAAPTQAEAADLALRRTTFTDAEIAEGFFKIAFGAEYNLAGHTDRIRKFVVPVRVYADSRAQPDRRAQVATVVADIKAHVANLDIAVTAEPKDANVGVRLVRNRDINRTIREFFGPDHAKSIQRSLDPQCLSGFRKDEFYRIEHADVILPVDAGDFTFFDCAYEEMLQALGPINDDPTVPWSMFNDDVRLGFFGLYDQYLLNILYDPRIKAGMTVAEVRALLPAVLPTVRAIVARRNPLPPSPRRRDQPLRGRESMNSTISAMSRLP